MVRTRGRFALVGISVGGGALAALLVLAASLVTCSRCCRARDLGVGFVDRATVESCDAVYARWRATR